MDEEARAALAKLAESRPELWRLLGATGSAGRPPVPLPCVHEGAVVEACTTCGGGRRHVRDCSLHERCTRDHVSDLVRACSDCFDYRPPSALHITANRGIGDAVSGLYAACGLASALQEPVTYHTHHPAWLAGVSHPWLTVAPDAPAGADMGIDYEGELNAAHAGTCPTRVQWYCNKASEQLRVPLFRGVRPSTVARPEPVTGMGYTVISPFSAWKPREWPGPNWGRLADELTRLGRRVVVLAAGGSEWNLKRIFGPLPVELFVDRPVGEVLALIANAEIVYGNDSGMAHLAGLHGVKAVAVMTHLRGSFVFGDTAPTVRAVGADPAQWPCQGCAWRGPNYQPVCNHGCGALISLGLDRVLQVGG